MELGLVATQDTVQTVVLYHCAARNCCEDLKFRMNIISIVEKGGLKGGRDWVRLFGECNKKEDNF